MKIARTFVPWSWLAAVLLGGCNSAIPVCVTRLADGGCTTRTDCDRVGCRSDERTTDAEAHDADACVPTLYGCE
jgi:hypothetical protein